MYPNSPTMAAPNNPIYSSANLRVEDRKVLVRSTETEPDATHGMDQWIPMPRVDLAAEATNIDVDDIGRWIEMQIPDVLQQHGPGNHPADVANQIFKQLSLPRQQLNLAPATVDDPRQQVHRRVPAIPRRQMALRDNRHPRRAGHARDRRAHRAR